MPAYDGVRSTPPAPFALVTLRNPDVRKSIFDVPMLLDTGADLSLIPRLASEALSLPTKEAEGIRLLSYDGAASNATVARAETILLGKTFLSDSMLVDDNHGILGRDILNQFSLYFDGPKPDWGELPR